MFAEKGVILFKHFLPSSMITHQQEKIFLQPICFIFSGLVLTRTITVRFVYSNYTIYIYIYKHLQIGSGSEWYSNKMTRCVYLAQRQNDTVRHFGTVCHFGTEDHFGTATKFLSFIFLSNFILGF